MNYTLAKQLKDAGFPFKDHDRGSDYCLVVGCDGEWHNPTLSELIEACGPDFVVLERWENDLWTAANGAEGSPIRESARKIEGEGKTPEEAVANLWLKLNQ